MRIASPFATYCQPHFLRELAPETLGRLAHRRLGRPKVLSDARIPTARELAGQGRAEKRKGLRLPDGGPFGPHRAQRAIEQCQSPAPVERSFRSGAIDGFELETGPARERCGGGGTARGLRASAATDEEATRAIDCLLLDKMLRDNVPKDAIWRRTTRPGDLSGTLRVAKPAEVSPRLRAHGAAIAKIARSARLVQAVMADNDGVTNTVLVALTSDLRVSSVWIEERFAE
jgi:hypothetical protein